MCLLDFLELVLKVLIFHVLLAYLDPHRLTRNFFTALALGWLVFLLYDFAKLQEEGVKNTQFLSACSFYTLFIR